MQIGTWDAFEAIGISFLASIAAYLIYQLFYGSKHIGAGIHRTFILGGPAITALFLCIRTSIPLGLGGLGALSFVRFRTPIKDPAEIGYLVLVIASSIASATHNYVLIGLLFALVIGALVIQWLFRNQFTLFSRASLMISVDKVSFPDMETKLTAFLNERLSGLRLETMSVLDDRVSLHYQYRSTDFDRMAFTTDLNKLTGDAKVEIFVG
jgi:hypothetical protein